MRRDLDINSLKPKLGLLIERQKAAGTVEIKPRITCGCGRRRLFQDMITAPYTGAVANVVTMLCKNCPAAERKELLRHSRLVCAGCKEQIAFIEPGKDPKDGFVWEPGKWYHVNECPSCAGADLKTSVIVEKILFYERTGRRYKSK